MISLARDASKDSVPGEEDARRLIAQRFGRALRRLREVSGKSAISVAAELGYTPAGLSNLENEKTSGPPDLYRVLRVLETFGINPELFWVLVEAPAVEARYGVPPEMERRLAVAEAIAQKALEEVRRERQGLPEQTESPQQPQ